MTTTWKVGPLAEASGLTAGRAPSTGMLWDALQAIGGTGPEGGRTLRRHLDDEQMQVLESRAAALGPAMHYLLEIEWPELYRRAERLRADGVPPTDRRVRRLVARMDELSTLFSGGDAEIGAGVRAAWSEDPAAMSGDPAAAASADEWRALADYLDLARRSTEEGTRS